MPSSIGTELVKIKLPSDDAIRKLSQATQPAHKFDPADWQSRYLPPGSEKNPGRFWKLPQLSIVLDDFKYCGGQTVDFVMSITGDPGLQRLLMMELHEELSKEENIHWLNRYREIMTYGKKVQLGFGIDRALGEFQETGEMNASMLAKLGAEAMPETFGNSAHAKAADDKSALDEQDKKVEDHIADLE